MTSTTSPTCPTCNGPMRRFGRGVSERKHGRRYTCTTSEREFDQHIDRAWRTCFDDRVYRDVDLMQPPSPVRTAAAPGFDDDLPFD